MGSEKLLNCHPLLNDRVRLSILAALVSAKGDVPFAELLEVLQLSKGNLSSHMRKLEDEKLILVKKEFHNRKPRRTSLAITEKGQKELKAYVNAVVKFTLRR